MTSLKIFPAPPSAGRGFFYLFIDRIKLFFKFFFYPEAKNSRLEASRALTESFGAPTGPVAQYRR